MVDIFSVGPPFVSPRLGIDPVLDAPPEEGSVEYYELLVEALAVRVYVEAGEWPSWFMESKGLPGEFHELPEWLQKAILPPGVETLFEMRDRLEGDELATDEACLSGWYKLHGDMLPRQAAELVRMDHWLDLLLIIERYLSAEGFELKDEFKNKVDVGAINFVENISCVAYGAGRIAEKFEECFNEKYAHLEVRPVSKVGKLLGVDSENVLDDLKRVLQSYPHPGHWAFPAGHGTDAGATFASVVDRWELPDETVEDLRVGCLAFAHFRTFSFMHTSNENQVGFELGAG